MGVFYDVMFRKRALVNKLESDCWSSCCRIIEWRSQPKILLGEAKCLTLGEQQNFFVWDAVSQSTKLLDMLNIWGGMAPLVPLGRAELIGSIMSTNPFAKLFLYVYKLFF